MTRHTIVKGLLSWNPWKLRYVGFSKKFADLDKLVFGLRLALLWTSASVGIIGLIFGFDLVGQGIEQVFSILFEFAQEKLETLFLAVFKLDLYHAQMATAYTGFAILLVLGIYLFRKFTVAIIEIKQVFIQERDKALVLCAKHWHNIMTWWDSLDGFNRFSAVIGLTVVAVPIMSAICLLLGKFVAELV